MLQYLRDTKFWHATAVLVGTMVGVGIYGIPFAFAKAGFLVGVAWLVVVAAVMLAFNLLFSELTLATRGVHQVSGYISIWLGPWGRRVATFANVLSLYGALLAFIIVAGEFLHNILSNFLAINPEWYAIVFAVAWSLVWFVRVRVIAAVELALIGVYAVIILIIAGLGIPHIALGNFSGWTPDFWYLPYGILLFAFAGMSAIPIQRQLLAGRERLMRPAIITAIAVTALFYLLFAFTVVGVSGDITSPEALSGLFGILGAPIILFGSVLGVLTISTSYVMLGTALYETFHIDYRLSAPTAWLLCIVPPIIFFLGGLRNFIDIIGLVGAVAVGLLGILLLSAFLKVRRSWWAWGLIVLFLAGMGYQLIVR
jgi:amino acid permease